MLNIINRPFHSSADVSGVIIFLLSNHSYEALVAMLWHGFFIFYLFFFLNEDNENNCLKLVNYAI